MNTKVVIIFSVVWLLSQQAHAQCTNPADLDQTFGPQNSGIVLIDFGAIDLGNGGIVIDDQGRIVVSGTHNILQFGVARLLPNGILDNSFDTDGKVSIDFGGNDFGTGGVVRDTQGRLIVAGKSDMNYAVARLLENGSLDTTFDTDGKVVGTSADIIDITGVKLNKDGKIVLFGSANNNLIVIQLNIDGSLDTTFGDAGRKEINFGGIETTNSDFIIDTQGRIVIVGRTNVGPNPDNFVVARLNADGSLDTTFGTNGKVTVDTGVTDNADAGIALTRSGKIIVQGESDGNIVVFQLNNDGSLDTTFGSNGFAIIDLGDAKFSNGGITLDSWGNIYAYGRTKTPANLLVARLTKDGTLDSTFGNNGVTTIGDNLSSDFGGITIDAQGRIVLLGTSGAGDVDFAVVRLCGDQLPAFVTALREKYRVNCSVLP